jgi:methylamine--corrinoid protein Co-methyltransferase
MITYLDVIKAIHTGRICSERDFDLRVFAPKLKEVLKAREIEYDPENPVPDDDALADDLWSAAMDFYCDVGTYCLDTERIVKFDENDITQTLKTAPRQFTFGEEKQRKVLIQRRPEDIAPPWCFLGAGGAAVSSEENLLRLVQGYASIPVIDSLTSPALTTVEGTRIVGGSPLEIYGAIRAIGLARQALSRAGKPGLPIMNCISTASSAIATIAASQPQFGLRPSDGWLCGTLAEMKVDYGVLSKGAYLLSWGANVCSETAPVLGGYAGGPEGTALVNAAYNILGTVIQKASYQLSFPIHSNFQSNTARNTLWAISLSGQGIARNASLPVFMLGYLASGPMTEMVLYETAAWVIAAVASGTHIEAEGVCKATHVDHFTPMEPGFAAEVAYAATGIKRDFANELVKTLLSKYEDKIKDAPTGKKFEECYDMTTGKPSEDYVRLYSKIRKELEDLGLKFKY